MPKPLKLPAAAKLAQRPVSALRTWIAKKLLPVTRAGTGPKAAMLVQAADVLALAAKFPARARRGKDVKGDRKTLPARTRRRKDATGDRTTLPARARRGKGATGDRTTLPARARRGKGATGATFAKRRKSTARSPATDGGLTLAQAARLGRTTISSLRYLIGAKRLTAKKVGKGIRAPLLVDKADLLRAVAAHRAPRTAATPKAPTSSRGATPAVRLGALRTARRLTVAQAAQVAGVSVPAVRQWIVRGKLAVRRRGKGKRAAVIIPGRALQRLLAQRADRAAAPAAATGLSKVQARILRALIAQQKKILAQLERFAGDRAGKATRGPGRARRVRRVRRARAAAAAQRPSPQRRAATPAPGQTAAADKRPAKPAPARAAPGQAAFGRAATRLTSSQQVTSKRVAVRRAPRRPQASTRAAPTAPPARPQATIESAPAPELRAAPAAVRPPPPAPPRGEPSAPPNDVPPAPATATPAPADPAAEPAAAPDRG